MEQFLNWKIIVIHAFLLLIAGVAFGIFEVHPSSFTPDVVLLNYLMNQCFILFVYMVIFAHITYKTDHSPVAHALLALLLSDEIASMLLAFLLSYLGAEPEPIRPIPFLVFEYISLLVVLLAGIKAGISLKQRKILRAARIHSASTNA
jgi:hypothetical protein